VGTVFGKFKGLFAKRLISARYELLIEPIRRPGEACDVAISLATLLAQNTINIDALSIWIWLLKEEEQETPLALDPDK
jgi:hypothetical protein